MKTTVSACTRQQRSATAIRHVLRAVRWIFPALPGGRILGAPVAASRCPRQQGSILVVTLLTCFIIGLVLGSYLRLIQAQSLSVARAQIWNAGVAIAEAGVEEALAHLNTGGMF